MMNSDDLYSALLSTLKLFSLSEVLEFEKKYDEQYHALEYLYSRLLVPRVFVEITILNALVSYQLNCTGERYWWEFARYFAKGGIDPRYPASAMERFLRYSRCNLRLHQQKIRRLKRAERTVVHYTNDLNKLRNKLYFFTLRLARALGSEPRAKTIVFSAKMANYALRIVLKEDFAVPFEIPIPVDSRISKITKKLTDRDPVEFWNEVSRRVGVPPIHIDSLLWVGFRLAKEGSLMDSNSKLEALIKFIRILDV